MATASKNKGVEVVEHKYGTRVKVFVHYNLQPKKFNQINIGAEVEDDVEGRSTIPSQVRKSFDGVLKDLEKQVKRAFAVLGFTFP